MFSKNLKSNEIKSEFNEIKKIGRKKMTEMT